MKSLSTLVLLFLLSLGVSAQDKSTPIFKDGEAQIVPAFNTPSEWITHDLWVETDFNTDGDDKNDWMHVSVTRPAQTDSEQLKLPVIYATSPYYAGVAGNSPGLFWDVKHELGASAPPRSHPNVQRRGQRPYISKSHLKKWIPRGYIVVHSSSPGTGLSQGAPTVGGQNESLAPKAVIEWLCGRRKGYTEIEGDTEVKAYWSTGKVGMTGTSYNGTLPLAAATTGVEGLEAIIPIAPNTSYYHYYRSNGLVRSPGGYLGEDIDVLYDFIHSGDESKRAYNNKTVRDTEMINNIDRESGDYNEFWAGRDYLNQMSKMKAALLMSHGFNDWNVMPEHSYRIYAKAKEMGLPTQIYYHQNGHGGPPPMTLMNRWFTRYLHGVENNVEADKKAWIVRENDSPNSPTAYDDYPNPKAQDITFYFGQGGQTAGQLTQDKSKAKGKEMLIDDSRISGKDHAKATSSKNRLLYVSAPLKEDTHISGLAKASITLSSSKPAANLSVWIVSLPWQEGNSVKITDNIITRGWADPQNHKSITHSYPLKKDTFYTVNFDLIPDDQIIPKGQQIGVMIFSSDSEFTILPKPGTALTIDLKQSHISLPIVNGNNLEN
ncbi:MAG: Xaa-Pro dipeptidyl-peptidase [Bacteroidetes bacterium MedPE-SWsnd-G2]|nr:MAG: Xaa-Pro dipeptidyl-peptidase [Bacteroidetes bacterium MedPE-SWsnd-G2]